MKKIYTLICALFLLSFFSLTADSQTYCTSRGTNTTHGYIKTVSIETINNTSGNNGGYADFTSKSATLLKGATYTIELTPGYSSSINLAYWTVYIDYNHDGIFEPIEMLRQKEGYIVQHLSFTIPTTALNGATRMRIQMQVGSYETNPCAIYTYGEVEDYTVILTNNISSRSETINPAITVEGNITTINLYPNPVKDNLTLEFTGANTGNVNLSIYNLSGQRVMTMQAVSAVGSNTVNLNTSDLAAGLYIIEIENNGQIEHRKFLVAR